MRTVYCQVWPVDFTNTCQYELGQALVRAGSVMALSSNKQPRPDWYSWESASRFSDNLWLAEMLQRTGSRLIHRYDLAEISGCAAPQAMAALFVAEAWLELVPGG